MTLSDGQIEALRELIASLREGRLDADGERRLNGLLAASPQARRLYAKYVVLQTCLELDEGGPAEPALPSQEARRPILGFLGNLGQQGVEMLLWPSTPSVFVVAMMCGALLAVLTMAIMPNFSGTPEDDWPALINQGPYVARLSCQLDSAWGGQGPVPRTGDLLASGRRLELREGMAEVIFDGGARVILKGPAVFDVSTPKSGFLAFGHLTGKVIEEARGFTIQTPSAKVVDLGTEFGLSVDRSGNVDVHVFDGKVEAQLTTVQEDTKHAPKIQITEHQAVRFNAASTKTETVPLDDKKFVRELPLSARGRYADLVLRETTLAAYYRFDRVLGHTVVNHCGIRSRLNGTWVGLPSLTAPGPRPPRWMGFEKGNVGLENADGANSKGVTVPGLSRWKQWTLEAWVKPHHVDGNPKGGQNVLCKGKDWRGGVRFGLHPDGQAHSKRGHWAVIHQSIGKKRRLVAQSPTKAQDELWYHLAATYDGLALRLYVNGREVAKASDGFARALDGGDDPLCIATSMEGPVARGFSGVVDEVALYRRALSPETLAIRVPTRR